MIHIPKYAQPFPPGQNHVKVGQPIKCFAICCGLVQNMDPHLYLSVKRATGFLVFLYYFVLPSLNKAITYLLTYVLS